MCSCCGVRYCCFATEFHKFEFDPFNSSCHCVCAQTMCKTDTLICLGHVYFPKLSEKSVTLQAKKGGGAIYAFSKCFSMHFAVICVHCLFSFSLVIINLEGRKPHALQTLFQIWHKQVTSRNLPVYTFLVKYPFLKLSQNFV